MATPPLPSSSAVPPTLLVVSPPPLPTNLPPPPLTLNSPPPVAPPHIATSPPPEVSDSPPPTVNSPPPVLSPPPLLPSVPPPTPSSASPPAQADPPAISPPSPSLLPTSPPLSSPPPVINTPPITLPPPSSSPPPPSAKPPIASSPPPPLAKPPIASSPPPPLAKPPIASSPPPPSAKPPIASSPPPPSAKPPIASSPLPPSAKPPIASSPPPPSAKPPIASSPPPAPAKPPIASSPPPPLVKTPVPSPPSPVSQSPPPASPTPPSIPLAPPPKNSSNGTPPLVPSTPSAPDPTNSPPLPSPNAPPGSPSTPNSPSGNKSSIGGDTDGVSGVVGGGSDNGGSGVKTEIVVPIVVVAAFLILGLVGLALWHKKRKKSPGGYAMPSPLTSSHLSETSYPHSPSVPFVHHSSGSSPTDPGMGSSKACFSYQELYNITNGFSDQNLLGEGGFGCVYKGCLSDGREVAVKQLKVGGSQGEREFTAEVEIIGRVHHRHLVSLVGFCISDNQRLLVYDFVPNNTLDYHLHMEGRPVLDWATRVKVAAGAARGIAYLHEDCHPRIIHRDIKSSNILLDNNFEAQVSDFGLARLAPMDAVTHVTTRVMGTFGYLAPEYASSGKLTEKSDVYSFGVVLLELITGRKPVDTSQPVGDESLVEWARPLLSRALETGDFSGLTDPRLENNYNKNELIQMVEAAAACVRHSASMRPRMGLVVRALDSLADIDLSNGIAPGQSELFNVPQSAEIRLFQRMAFGPQDYSTDFSRSSWQSQREL